MTLQQFLFNNERVDLNVESTIKAHIRQYVQNIDVLASKDLRDITHDEIRDIYMAILFDSYPQRAFFVDEALDLFVKDAKRLKVGKDDINHIISDV